MDAPYALPETAAPGVVRVLARNPSPFTFTGTQTFLVGDDALVVIDPGPDDADHVEAIVMAAGGRPIAAIACTHTHRDHSPAAALLKAATGAPIVGCAALSLAAAGPRADAAFDGDYAPDRVLGDGDAIALGGGAELVAVATPGHTSNHLCFAYGDILFTGDHVMGWSTTVVVPPDGDMGAYMASLEKLRARDDRLFLPAHGPAVTKPAQYLRGLIGHRMQRARQILRLVGEGVAEVPGIVAAAYPGLDPRLVPAAGGSVSAHLVDLERRGLVQCVDERWTTL
ncbi:MBL fold metallo-hydrolase [Sphingomonas mesophila]|uniref:MBL fold metallo-hydrolase n=1 Tax=Sphingomonas mesophila TaxID=2303576 RepID=UPI001F085F60|nr:MBL fold metallo-hydrolase [Sphingomonas mesophila]